MEHQLDADFASARACRPQLERASAVRGAISSFREHHLLPMAGVVVAPLVIAGYVGLTALFLLPLLGLRRMFPRREDSIMSKLFVDNLSFEVTSFDLRAVFCGYGQVRSAEVVMDRSSGRSRGFGFVEMPRPVHALAAIRGLHGTVLKGRTINVSPARPSERSA